MADARYNQRNPAVKRILQEVKEMQSDPSDDFMSLPLEENIFEWQFAIRGPRDTEFEGGIYHGRIQLPAEYPLKPPSFMLLTPNGRFETNTKICLSISNYHPEHWQPSWGVRTALVALIAFMPTNPNGALGSLEYPKEVRRELAIKSREAPKHSNPQRQKLIDEIHEYMLRKAPSVPQIQLNPTTNGLAKDTTTHEEVIDKDSITAATAEVPADQEMVQVGTGDVPEAPIDAQEDRQSITVSAGVTAPRRATGGVGDQSRRLPAKTQNSNDDRLLTWAAIGLSLAILFLIAKKFLKSNVFGGYVDSL